MQVSGILGGETMDYFAEARRCYRRAALFKNEVGHGDGNGRLRMAASCVFPTAQFSGADTENAGNLPSGWSGSCPTEYAKLRGWNNNADRFGFFRKIVRRPGA